MHETQREMVFWDGSCIVHETFCFNKILDLVVEYPYAQLISHPESDAEILKIAHFIGSASKLLHFVKDNPSEVFIIATEAGILHEMQLAVPHKKLIPAPAKEDNSCACSECAFMKLNTLEKFYRCLLNETPNIQLDAELIKKASVPLEKMMTYA